MLFLDRYITVDFLNYIFNTVRIAKVQEDIKTFFTNDK